MVEAFGADALRYLLLREVPFDRDGDVTVEVFLDRYNADLANDIGNLFSRTVTMISKYLGGAVETKPLGAGHELYAELVRSLEAYRGHMDRMEFSRALGAYWSVIQRANRFIEEKRPWDLAKDPAKRGELEEMFRELLAVLRASGVVLTPFMPRKMAEMLAQLGAREAHDERSSRESGGRERPRAARAALPAHQGGQRRSPEGLKRACSSTPTSIST